MGLLAFCIIPYVWSGADLMLRWGILLWYTTFGVFIGIIGVMDVHPLWPKFKINAFFRGIFIGAWLNFILVFFAYDKMEAMLSSINIMGMTSPFWFVLEGVILGAIIDLIATKYAGEGKDIL